jgi:hypothetical protein
VTRHEDEKEDASMSAPHSDASAPDGSDENAPVAPAAPKHFDRPKADIDAMRRSIMESLKKQAEAAEPPAQEPGPAAHEDNGGDGETDGTS